MKRWTAFILACLLLPAALAALAEGDAAWTDIGGTILAADYPGGRLSHSLEGEAFDWYLETVRYLNVDVVIANRRISRFGGSSDEIPELSRTYGEITGVSLVPLKAPDGAELAVRLRYTCAAPSGAEGPKRWIVEVVKLYRDSDVFLFTIARDADGKDYTAKIEALVASLHLVDAAAAQDFPLPDADDAEAEAEWDADDDAFDFFSEDE